MKNAELCSVFALQRPNLLLQNMMQDDVIAPLPPCLYDKYRFWLLHLNAHVRATMPAHKVSFISHAFLMFSATTVAMAFQPASCAKQHSNKDVCFCLRAHVCMCQHILYDGFMYLHFQPPWCAAAIENGHLLLLNICMVSSLAVFRDFSVVHSKPGGK